jgi:hypothetical protein
MSLRPKRRKLKHKSTTSSFRDSFTPQVDGQERTLTLAEARKYTAGLNKNVRESKAKMLTEFPIIPLGENVGTMAWHNCDENARKHFKATGDTLFFGYMLLPKGHPEYSGITAHAFNVRDGKVLEMTGGIDWHKETIYVGVAVPEKDLVKFSYNIKSDKVTWVRKQRKQIQWV